MWNSITVQKFVCQVIWHLKIPVTQGDLLLRHVATTRHFVWHVPFDMYPFFNAITCCMNSNQFEFMRHATATECHTHILSPHATCMCNNAVNKPIMGLPAMPSWLVSPYSDMLQLQVASCVMSDFVRGTCRSDKSLVWQDLKQYTYEGCSIFTLCCSCATFSGMFLLWPSSPVSHLVSAQRHWFSKSPVNSQDTLK